MKITIATNYDDWEGIYIDGILHTEGHKLSTEDVLGALGMDYVEIDAFNYLDAMGRLPQELTELMIEDE